MTTRSPSGVEPPPIPENEIERLEELRSLGMLDTASEERFDRYTRLIADLYEFPIVLVTLVDKDRQWFKSNCGLDFRETGREVSFCAHAINETGIFIVKDARQDRRFANNPLVTDHPHIRFYAGCTVRGPNGHPLGTLCVIDSTPREFDDRKCEQLKQFAILVERELCQSYELEKLRASIEFRVNYDPLTRLPNSRLLRDRINTLLTVREREGGSLAVVLFNVSGLRYINQAFGVAVGDELLREVANRLENAFPADAGAGRLGGDEFVLTLPTLDTDSDTLDARIAQIRTFLDRPYRAGGHEHFVNYRIGISVYPEHGRTADALIDKAASAVRTREPGGMATARHYSQAHALQVSERLHMETRLRRGLDEGRFRFEYQPIVSLSSGEVSAVEALIRWDDDEIEDTSPARFIPLAEQCGLIVSIGRWALTEVIRQLRSWCDADRAWSVPATVNISPPQLQQPDFARSLLDELERLRVPPALVQIEVTEFSLVLDTQRVRENLKVLKEAGVHSIIDDFGTGYCSMDYLRRMPVSALKIDRVFVGGTPEDRHDVAITRTILAMARSLDLTTVAEGVERRDQLDMLRAEGCDAIQGFLLARPAAPREIPGFIGKRLL